jgi:hypothetical protein
LADMSLKALARYWTAHSCPWLVVVCPSAVWRAVVMWC